MKKNRKPVWGGLECNEFYSNVCFQMTRATKREKEEVKRELAAHLQDHTEVLIEQGYDPYQAELRAIATMGDPKEIGNELNKSFSVFWFVCKWIAIAALGLILLIGTYRFLGEGISQNLRESILVRMGSEEDFSRIIEEENEGWTFEFGEQQQLDMKLETEHRVVHLNQLALGVMTDEVPTHFECYVVAISWCNYGKALPGGSLNAGSIDVGGIKNYLPVGGTCDEIGGNPEYYYHVYTVEYGAEEIEVVWERYGDDIRATIPLNWEDVP